MKEYREKMFLERVYEEHWKIFWMDFEVTPCVAVAAIEGINQEALNGLSLDLKVGIKCVMCY